MPPAFRQEILQNQSLAPARMRLGRQKLPGKKRVRLLVLRLPPLP